MAAARQPRKKKAEPRAADGLHRPSEADELRRGAEERLDGLSAASPAASPAASAAPEDVTAIVHELRVHQIELEMQNEELRDAELELEEQREKYFALFNLAPVCYLTIGDQNIVGDANLTAAHLLGVELELLIGQPFSIFVFAPDRDVYYLHQRELQQTEEPQTCELRLQRVGGAGAGGGATPAHFWAHLESRPQRAGDGEPSSSWVTFTDVSERKQAEEALRESEEKYRSVVERASDGIVITQDGCYVFANPAAAEMAGYAPEELVGMDLLKVVDPGNRPAVVYRIARRLAGENAPGTYEVELLRKDGEPFTVDASAATITYEGAPGDLMVVRDITARTSAEVELERRGARLEELLEERERNLEQLAQSLSSITGVVSRVVETRDPYTAGHQLRVSELSVRISEEMGLSARQIDDIRVAALIHDVGKMSVPAEILSKPGVLSPLEFELIKGHAEAGYRILAAANMEGSAAEIDYQHHERCDGSGYPRGLLGDELLLGAKVLMVADVVEAMSSDRPYRAALGMEPALAEIERGAGRQYDAEVCAACNRVLDAGFAFTGAVPAEAGARRDTSRAAATWRATVTTALEPRASVDTPRGSGVGSA